MANPIGYEPTDEFVEQLSYSSTLWGVVLYRALLDATNPQYEFEVRRFARSNLFHVYCGLAHISEGIEQRMRRAILRGEVPKIAYRNVSET